MSFILSLLIVTFVLVVVGELLPKLVTLQNPERVALVLTRPMVFASLVLLPFAWTVQKGGALLLRPFGIDPEKMDSPSISREELALLVRAGESEGIIEETHADVVSKVLRFDKLDSADIMIHRLDVKWIDVNLSREEVIAACAKIPHSRVPVCRGDVDDVVGILYVLDLIRKPQVEPFSLEALVRPVEVVPENLTLTKVINRMRESRTQILVVRDEYGGTSGLITLEDVVEEVFGEIEDQIESERAVIEQITTVRYSVRAEVRFDELLDFLDIDSIPRNNTETLATILVESLQRMPRLGDSIQTEIGTMIIENMARQRITRVRVLLSPETLALMEAESQD
jgi:putative hemolysin